MGIIVLRACITYGRFVCELPEIVSCAYFEILLVVCDKMIDPFLGASVNVIFIIPFDDDMSSLCNDLGRFIISSSVFFFHYCYLSS